MAEPGMWGGLVTLAAVAIIVWEAAQPAVPPALAAHIVEGQSTPAGHVATIKVVNDGDETAAAVEIEGVLGFTNEPEMIHRDNMVLAERVIPD